MQIGFIILKMASALVETIGESIVFIDGLSGVWVVDELKLQFLFDQ